MSNVTLPDGREIPIVEDLDDIENPAVGDLAILRTIHRLESMLSEDWKALTWDGEGWGSLPWITEARNGETHRQPVR